MYRTLLVGIGVLLAVLAVGPAGSARTNPDVGDSSDPESDFSGSSALRFLSKEQFRTRVGEAAYEEKLARYRAVEADDSRSSE
ncbi:hypothetical protein GIS00_17005 [Nakamurella sp. YIM 132087]|uniref:Uncharacterized protein n=1 Tax=Nakamurella alba TaxID=2665158 RepID=A0A7K1FS33_9ACTN|nr:hypothetical protein [Nakamurella alba]MTD15634.1 hypothetical protein [Nakamurella alba]